MSGWNTSSRKSKSERTSFADQPLLLKAVDLGLALSLVVAPFCMGGRTPLGQLILCVLSTLTMFFWCLFQGRAGDARWKFTGAEPVMLLGIGLIILQYCPLPPDWLNSLSPKMPQILSIWNEENSSLLPGTWNRISFTPYDTLSNLVMVVACCQLFFVAAQRLRRLDDLRNVLSLIAVGGVAMAAFGLVQLLLSNGKFFWFYEHPQTDTSSVAKGAFTNANHFAHYLSLTIPAQLLLLVEGLGSQQFRHERRRSAPPLNAPQANGSATARVAFWGASLAITGLALLLSMSRSGIIFCSVGVMTTLLVLWRKNLLGTRAVAIVFLLATASLSGTLIFGDLASRMVEQNFAELTSNDLQKLDRDGARRNIWQANLDGIADFPVVGTGLGSHREVYWRWFNIPHNGTEYSHAESGFLQIPLETGIAGASLVGLLWLITLLWCAQGLWNASTSQSSGVIAVAFAGILVSLGHSLFDFVWYVPACVNLVLIYAICAWRISLMRFSETTARDALPPAPTFGLSRLAWLCAIPVTLGLGSWMVQQKLPEVAAAPLWDEYQRLSKRSRENANSKDEFNTSETLLKLRDELAIATAEADPHNHRAQLQAGIACLHRFTLEQNQAETSMPLRQIREAARLSFQDPEEMNRWLDQPGVLGKNRHYLNSAIQHFRASLQGCPLQPRPYLELAELVWLEGGSEEQERALVQQAVYGRPHDARSNFALGTQLWLDGSQSTAITYWQKAFRQDAEYRGQIIENLATYVAPKFFLDTFELDQKGLRQLQVAYQKSEDRNGYLMIVDALAKASVKEAIKMKGIVAEGHWLLAHACFAERGDRKNAYRAAKEAVAANPSSYQAHQTLGVWLYQNQAYPEAVEHLTWCVRRKPDHEYLRNMAQQAVVKAEHQSSSMTAEGKKESIVR
ncbi:O-antigen ligase family protein [Planctomicrobium sp. SH664]|uniref:O-antigen ligase family protein n=1 Tax=Planctomicrobium sp. SH664 TaxID=3448125 RepID=UPI003F5BC16C